MVPINACYMLIMFFLQIFLVEVEAAVISMGTEVSDLDLMNIKDLCDQVLALSEYGAQLYEKQMVPNPVQVFVYDL